MPDNPHETNIQHIPTDRLLEPRVPLRLLKKSNVEYLELRDAIQKHGFNGAILVRPYPNRPDYFEVVTGWHRCNCCKDLGLPTVPCIVRDLTDDEVLALQIQENDVRIPTEPIEYARHLWRLRRKSPDLTLAGLAKLSGRSMAWVGNHLNLLRLRKKYQKLVEQGKISLQNAYYLGKLPYPLQDEHIKAARSMTTPEFKALAVGVQKALSEKKKQGHLRDLLLRDFEPEPHLRTISEIRKEIFAKSAMNAVLLSRGATNAQEGFLAALDWVLHMDDASIEKKKQQVIRNRRPTDHVRQQLEAEKDEAFDVLDLEDFGNFDPRE